jgi:hypothetical protein
MVGAHTRRSVVSFLMKSEANLGARLEVGELGPVDPLDAGLVEHVARAGGDVACAVCQLEWTQ